MKRLCVIALFSLLAAPCVFADTQDTVVFRTRMLPDNEVPPISAAGNSAAATITVRVARDDRGNINAATVTFDIDYTITSALTFTGLHIHNGPAGVNAPVVIDTGISGTNTVAGPAGSGKITRVVNYASTDTNGIRFVTGLLATPSNYYVNIHTTVNPGGFMRGQLQASRLILRPIMSPAFENPPIPIDAEGAALIDVQVNRDQTGAITSGTVIFDVDYRFPAPVTITGLHIHNGPVGVNAPVVIDTGTNGTSTAVTNVTRGNIFRIVEINSSNTTGIAALNGLFTDPSQYYVNMHTTVNPGGVIRGQLTPTNVYVFFNQMTQAEENPPTGVNGFADSMTYVRIDRDSTGNVVGGAVSFNVHAHQMDAGTTFTGLHIHNGKVGVNGPVVINTGLSATNTVTADAGGDSSISREIEIRPADSAFDFLRGLVENPENYYVNIHTTQFPGGVVRSQLARETYHFKANMSTANEVPPVTGADTSATGWITARINRDANGTMNGGNVTFDVNFTNSGPVTFTGLHIHYPGVAGINAPVIINTGLSGTSTVDSTTGAGNITRVVTVDPTSAIGLTTLNALITAPDTAYVNIHSTQFPGGVARSQMFPFVNTVAQTAGGADWTTMITIRNPSTTSAVQGIVDFFQSNGSLMPDAITDPNISFLIPAGGSTTLALHNKGNIAAGFAKVFSNGTVTVESRFLNPAFTLNNATGTTATGRSVSIPVSVGATASQNTGIALIASSAGTLNLSLRDSSGNVITGGSRTIDVTAGQQLSQYVKQLLPSVTASSFTGTLTISTSAGTISALALQFDGTISPVTVTAQP
jgi:hypothetical protein